MWARSGRSTTRTGKGVARRPQRRVGAVCGDLAALQRRLGRDALRQGLRHASPVGWRSDGARGRGRRLEERFTADARGGLDCDHAAQPRGKRAAAGCDRRTTQARRGVGGARPRLRHGHPEGVLADLADAWAGVGVPAPARDPGRPVSAALERHHEHIDDAADKALDGPLGAGMVERAGKWRIQPRFTGVGMRGREDGGNPRVPRRRACGTERVEAWCGAALSPDPSLRPRARTLSASSSPISNST